MEGISPRLNNRANLKRVIAIIDEEDQSAMDVDVKAASEGRKGAGQYYTPRPTI